MIDQVKYFAKLSSVAVFTVVKLYAVAISSTIASLVACVLIMISSASGTASQASGTSSFLVQVSERPWHCILVLLIVACGVLLVVLSGKYAVNKVIHRIVTDKSESTIVPMLDKAIEKFRKGRPAILDRASSASASKLKLVQEAKDSSGNRWLRGALVLAFKKARLDDIDLAKDDTRMSEVIRDRTMLALQEMSKPGKTMFLAAVAVQWLSVLVAWMI